MVGHQRDLLLGEHGEIFDPRLHRLLRIGVIGELETRPFHQQNLVMRQVADEAGRFAVAVQHENHVAERVPRRRQGRDSGQDFLVVGDELDSIPVGQQVLPRVRHELLRLAFDLGFVGPEIEVRLADVDRGVGENAPVRCIHHAADVIDVGVRDDDGIDLRRIVAGFPQALYQTAGCRPEHFLRAHAGIEQHEMRARIDDGRVLFEHDVGWRQEIVGQEFVEVFLRGAEEGAGRLAERQRPVRDHRDLHLAEREAVEIGRLRCEQGRLGQSLRSIESRCGAGKSASCEQCFASRD